ncbi:unnamed protein product [Sphenostylis stenocarpa]|uniref:Major facilitator superfamily (MFS) profile domain-containing protein n=1 Tax=Sphenostylis stenocarpa TaxID=92480 RepID=A0AA86RZ16_9FABA|nr:unnamed protein product [Sphenostylis stenocarpa]
MEPQKKHEGKPESSSSSSQPQPTLAPDMDTKSTMIPTTSWFTPKRLLAIFCVINLLNYLDRGAIASNGVNGSQGTCEGGTCKSGTGIQGDFKLNNFQDGVLSSAFMVGLLVSSPIFASLAKSVNPFRLIGVGLSIWTLATLCCGFSFNFWSIAACRMLVGIGEASFISLAAPFIDDNAPISKKTVWLGTFYMCIPAGYAVGYVYGGLVGSHLSWRYAFWVEAILMFPFAVLGFVMKPLQLKGFAPTDSGKAPALETAVSEIQDVDASNGRDKSTQEPSRSEYAFLALFAVGELLVFATQAPVNYVCLHCVKPSLRPLSMAFSTIAIHIFGDVPSSPLVGVIQEFFCTVWIDIMKIVSLKYQAWKGQTRDRWLKTTLLRQHQNLINHKNQINSGNSGKSGNTVILG